MSPKQEPNPVEASTEIVLPKGVKIYPIVKLGDPVLERPSVPVTKFDDDLRQL